MHRIFVETLDKDLRGRMNLSRVMTFLRNRGSEFGCDSRIAALSDN